MAVANANVRQTSGGTLHMRKAIATVALSGTLTDKFEAIAAAGFDGAEIFEPNLLAHDGSARGGSVRQGSWPEH
jgi:sugar phosphate isomerase/epimerase